MGGAIAGATMGVLTPALTGVLASETMAAGISGAVAGIIGGQAEALADASIDQFPDGGTLSAAGQKLLGPILGPARRIDSPLFFDDVYYQSKGYITGFLAGLVRASSDVLQEAGSQVIDDADNPWLGDY